MKRGKSIDWAKLDKPTSVLTTTAGPVDTSKLTDNQYKQALIIGIQYLVKTGELDYDKIKP